MKRPSVKKSEKTAARIPNGSKPGPFTPSAAFNIGGGEGKVQVVTATIALGTVAIGAFAHLAKQR